MNVERHQAVVIGGGPAGLAAAIQLKQKGIDDVVVLEREHRTGGILRQCIHDGFGLTRFGETLSGPEYAQRFVDQAEELGITCLTDTTVLSLEADRTVTASGHAGIYTAGVAQEYINLCNLMVGREVVILGSGDIGLIMARRMTLEGAKVLACVELMPYSGGLTRNIVQCLEDYGIPLYLSHTITNIKGHQRVEQVTVSEVGPDRRPIPGTEMAFDCDTVLLSVGLIPENELTRQAGIAMDRRTSGAVVFENMETGVPGIFACGNVVHVHDLVDYVSAESERAGAAAAAWVQGRRAAGEALELLNGDGVSYTVPQRLRLDALEKPAQVFFRVNRVTRDAQILATDAGGKTIARFKREHMAPGEMEQVALPPQLLKSARGPLTLSIREV